MNEIKDVIAQELETVNLARNIAIVAIDDCGQCPYFDNDYYSYNQECIKLDMVIAHTPDGYTIPDACPVRVDVET